MSCCEIWCKICTSESTRGETSRCVYDSLSLHCFKVSLQTKRTAPRAASQQKAATKTSTRTRQTIWQTKTWWDGRQSQYVCLRLEPRACGLPMRPIFHLTAGGLITTEFVYTCHSQGKKHEEGVRLSPLTFVSPQCGCYTPTQNSNTTPFPPFTTAEQQPAQ
jgi:hypothetical protein